MGYLKRAPSNILLQTAKRYVNAHTEAAEKSAVLGEYKLHPLIVGRWSPYAFTDKPVEPKKLLSCFEAARWGPSSFNEQPWKFIIASKQDGELYAKLFNALVEFNQGWVKAAPLLMLTATKTNFALNNLPNPHCKHDVGLAMGNFLMQATHLGLYVHQMSGFDFEKARVAAKLPEGYEPAAMVAIGYHGDLKTLPEPLQQREEKPRVRKDLKEIVYHGEFGRHLNFNELKC